MPILKRWLNIQQKWLYIRDLSLSFFYLLIQVKAEQVAKMKDKAPAFIKMFLNKMFERNPMLTVMVGSTDAFYPKIIAYEDQKLQNIKSCWLENTVQVWAWSPLDHWFSTVTKFSKKITFFLLDTHTYVRVRNASFFGKICEVIEWMISLQNTVNFWWVRWLSRREHLLVSKETNAD